MTSSSCRTSSDAVKHRPFLKNKNPVLYKSEARRMAVSTYHLSPEAQQAMIMTQEESKENRSSAIQTVETNHCNVQENNDACNNNSMGQRDIKMCNNGKDSKHNSRAPSSRSVGSRVRASPSSKKMGVSSLSSSGKAATPRSQSTLSITDRNHSISDNTESCYNYSSNNNTLTGPNVTNSRCGTKDEAPISASMDLPTIRQTQKQDPNKNSTKENNEKVNNGGRNEGPEQTERPESFVLALDRVLEKKFISRLRGDITDMGGISEPGMVRALDGGRLTNAQEVVVNVCHDDDRELIFNDDDEESLSNAKAVSEIRISLWMKYNEGFQPEDIVDDDYARPPEDGNNNLGKSSEAAPVPAQAPRDISADKSCSERANTKARLSNKSKWQSMKNDVNNNSGSLIKSKSGSSNNLRDLSSTRTASTNRNDGGKGSRVSSLKKEKKS